MTDKYQLLKSLGLPVELESELRHVFGLIDPHFQIYPNSRKPVNNSLIRLLNLIDSQNKRINGLEIRLAESLRDAQDYGNMGIEPGKGY